MRKQRLLSLFVLLLFCVSMISSCAKNKSKTLSNEAYDLGIEALKIADMHPKVLAQIDNGSLSEDGKEQIKESLREDDSSELLAISNKLDDIYETEDAKDSNKATYTLCLSSYVLLLSFEVQSGTPETIIEKRNLVAEEVGVEKTNSKPVSGTTSKTTSSDKSSDVTVLSVDDVKSTLIVNYFSVSKPNSVGGVDWTAKIENTSQKTIKYITFIVEAYNAVDDAVECEITGKSVVKCKGTGPVVPTSQTDPSAVFTWETVWYNSTISYVKTLEIQIEYMDGTQVSISEDTLKKLNYPTIAKIE